MAVDESPVFFATCGSSCGAAIADTQKTETDKHSNNGLRKRKYFIIYSSGTRTPILLIIAKNSNRYYGFQNPFVSTNLCRA